MKKEAKNKAIRRLRIISGQVKGLERMVNEDKYCIDVLNQSLAVREALSSFESLVLENHLTTCVGEQFKAGQKAKAVREVLSVYKLSRQK